MTVSHDRAFLDRCARRIVEITEPDHGAVEYAGGWSEYVHQREVARGQAYARHGRYVAERDRLTDRVRRQRQWSEEGVRNAKRKARDNDRVGRGMKVERSEQQAAKVRATERAIARLDAVDKPWEGWRLQLRLAGGGGGEAVADLEGAVVARGAFRLGRSTSTCAAATASWSRDRTAAARARCSAPCWAACPSWRARRARAVGGRRRDRPGAHRDRAARRGYDAFTGEGGSGLTPQDARRCWRSSGWTPTGSRAPPPTSRPASGPAP